MRAFKRLRSASGGNEGCSILKMSGNRYLEKSIRSPLNGGVAQLGEHLLCKQGVRSSILLISTMGRGNERRRKATGKELNSFGRIAQVVRAHA